MAAEVGQLDLAYDYLGEAALMDLDDLEHNVRDGVHMGSLAGAWLAVVAGLGGMRDHGGNLTFAPRLPAPLRGLTFRLTFRGRLLEVEVNHREATYRLLEGDELGLAHHGEAITVAPDAPVRRPVPAVQANGSPKQPPGREPIRRGP